MPKYLTVEDMEKQGVPIKIQEAIKNILLNIQNLNKSGFSNTEALTIIQREGHKDGT